ncbi:MAG: calcium-binding protein, partial [Methylovulum sp.]|nr:calcium-binding protein [Methylovulum sp.]
GDTLTGDGGNNVIDGYTGNDTLIGGLGNDTYLVDNKGDAVTESSKLAAETDTVNSSVSYELGANLENLTLTGTAAINGTGNVLNNVLTGNAGANSLTGGSGVDRLTGGLGADLFKFNAVTDTGITAAKRDSIVDFNHNQGDKIDLSAIDADTTLAGNNAFSTPTVGGAFNGVFANKGGLYFDQAAHVLYGNNDTDSVADFSILLTGVGGLVALDLVL